MVRVNMLSRNIKNNKSVQGQVNMLSRYIKNHESVYGQGKYVEKEYKES